MNKKIFVLFLLFFLQTSYALQEHTKFWQNTTIIQPISCCDEKFKYLIESRLRLIDNRFVFEHERLSGGLGYELIPALTGFVGFGYVLDKNISGVLFHEDRPFQLLRWSIYKSKCFNFTNNSLLEERKRLEAPQWAYRLREKFSAEIELRNWTNHTLDLSNEFFFNLNHPDWVSKYFYAENRAVIGIGTKIMKGTKVSIGYINQYQFDKIKTMSNGLIITLDVIK